MGYRELARGQLGQRQAQRGNVSLHLQQDRVCWQH